jgi:hypothetical protein
MNKKPKIKLYDEEIVVNVMIGVSVIVHEYLKHHIIEDGIEDDLCDFIENNSDMIIQQTLENLSQIDE